jgi:DNA helicase-2/ATP-dependent DNA helicase PcrA
MSWYRVLQLMDGVGPISAQKMIGHLLGREVAAPAEDAARDLSPLRRLLDDPPLAPPAARSEFAAFREAVKVCIDGDRLPPASQVERIRKFYDPIFQRIYDNPTIRLRDIEQLEQIASGYRSRSAFVTDLTLDPPSSTQDLAGPPLLDEDFLILSTIHSAKGCEWTSVNIIHAADGMIPSDMATADEDEIEEERRLLYVAMTRAKDTLTIYFPLRYYYYRKHPRGDRHSYSQLTRFIGESDLQWYDRASGKKLREQLDEAGGLPSVTDAAKSVDAMLNDLLG